MDDYRTNEAGQQSVVGEYQRRGSLLLAGSLDHVEDTWISSLSEETRVTDVRQRGVELVDLLLLTDALPPLPHRELEIPPFRDLCGRH